MIMQGGKITCTKCGNKGAKLISTDNIDRTNLQCNKCKRIVECSLMKIGEALFDKQSMEGKSLI